MFLFIGEIKRRRFEKFTGLKVDKMMEYLLSMTLFDQENSSAATPIEEDSELYERLC